MKYMERCKKLEIFFRHISKSILPVIYLFFLYAILISISYVALYPLLRCLSVALTSSSDYIAGDVSWIPGNPTLRNFRDSFVFFDYFKYGRNS